MKKVFLRLPIILLADSLYTSEPVMDICRNNPWEVIIRYKTGSIPGITEEYEKIPEKGVSGHAEFINDIDYNGKAVNMLRYWEELVGGYYFRADKFPKSLHIFLEYSRLCFRYQIPGFSGRSILIKLNKKQRSFENGTDID